MLFLSKVQDFSLIHASLIDFQSDEIMIFGSFVHLYSCLGGIGFGVLLSLSCLKLEV